ncbi:MAG TPA: hypothetical protein VHC22_20850 [Pirellulales bacterium]|nr:hypothetical protein [Pirellulales bacterium]
MGLDLFNVRLRIERAFQIQVSDEEFLGTLRDRDIVVGDIYELVLKKMRLQDVGRYSLRLHKYLWTEMQAALHSATGRPAEQIELGLALEILFPRETRRNRWQTLQGTCPYLIRELDYSRFIRLAGFVIALGMAAIELFHLWQIPGANFVLPFFGFLGLWMVYETYAKVLSIFAPLRNDFPSGWKTVKDLCRSVMAANYADVCRDCQMSSNERCAAVWEELAEILASVLDVDRGAVTFGSRLFADLGAS